MLKQNRLQKCQKSTNFGLCLHKKKKKKKKSDLKALASQAKNIEKCTKKHKHACIFLCQCIYLKSLKKVLGGNVVGTWSKYVQKK